MAVLPPHAAKSLELSAGPSKVRYLPPSGSPGADFVGEREDSRADLDHTAQGLQALARTRTLGQGLPIHPQWLADWP